MLRNSFEAVDDQFRDKKEFPCKLNNRDYAQVRLIMFACSCLLFLFFLFFILDSSITCLKIVAHTGTEIGGTIVKYKAQIYLNVIK